MVVPKDLEQFQPLNWDLGSITFKKTVGAPTFKKYADQREDVFKVLKEIKPTYENEKIPHVKYLHLVFIGLIILPWLIFPWLVPLAGFGRL